MATSGGAVHTPPSGPQPSQILTDPNIVAFDPKHAVPSQPIYFQRNDLLAFFIATNATNITVLIGYRWLTPQGEIKQGEFLTRPFTTNIFLTFPLYEGWLLSFATRVISAPSAGAWCFLQLFIARSPFPSIGNPMNAVIWQGFLPNATLNGWPGTPSKEITDGAGVLRSITGTTPAAGAEILETVPLQRRWNLVSFRAGLTTSATVANRFPGFLIDDGVTTLFLTRTSVAQVASISAGYEGAPGLQFYNDTQNNFVLPFTVPTLLKGSFRIRSSTSGLQAGDQWSAPQYLVQEWGEWDD